MARHEELSVTKLVSDLISVKTLKIGGDPMNGTASTAITATAAELNILDGVTATKDELYILDGVTATKDELNILDGATVTALELNLIDAAIATASFTIGAEAANVINVAVQLKDAAGVALAGIKNLIVFLSDDSTGVDVATTAPNGGCAIGTDGKILTSLEANKMFIIQCDADGQFDIDITQAGADTFYMAVVNPLTGKQIVSGAITFDATT